MKKTTFTLAEYDKVLIDLEFVQAALDVTLNLDDTDHALPIISEAISKTTDIFQLIGSMNPAEVTL